MNGLRHTDFTAQIVFSVTIRLVYRYHWIVCFVGFLYRRFHVVAEVCMNIRLLGFREPRNRGNGCPKPIKQRPCISFLFNDLSLFSMVVIHRECILNFVCNCMR